MHTLHAGRHEFNKVLYHCANCGHWQLQGALEFIKIGAWPASSSIFQPSRMNTVIDFELLRSWTTTSKNSPETSLKAFLQSVADQGEAYGSTQKAGDDKIGEVAFQRAFTEWTYLQDEVRVMYGKLEQHVCPAEHNGYQAVHIDGNMKVRNRGVCNTAE